MDGKADKTVARYAALICVGLWSMAFVFYIAPRWAIGEASRRDVLYLGLCAGTGMTFCWIYYNLLRAVRRLQMAPRALAAGGLLLAFTLVHSVSDTWLYDRIFHPRVVLNEASLVGPTGMFLLSNFVMLAGVYVLFLAGVGLVWSLLAIQERERRLAAAQAATQEAQLAALRAQINPHFLFNALNAVTALVGAGRAVEAEAVVARLSEFFRASLVTAPGALLTVEEELDVAGSYLDIESARFGARLKVDIEIDEAAREALIPHFLLQPLVENAVKHGVARSKRPVTVAVSARAEDDHLVLDVSDDAAPDGASPPARSTGVGLSNVGQRLAALYGPAAELTAEPLSPGYRVRIRLPLSRAPAARLAA